MEVGRRNIAYHFPTKEDILKEIARVMWDRLDAEREKRRQFPSFENLASEVQMYTAFQEEYAFIFSDTKVIKHPLLEKRFRDFCDSTIRDNAAAIAFAIKLGNMKEEPFPGAYHNLSLSIWIISLFWLPQLAIRKEREKKDDAAKVIWSLILPHFTEKGVESFKSFFGKAYFDSIGKPFKVELNMDFF